jgi:hypothetical protein
VNGHNQFTLTRVREGRSANARCRAHSTSRRCRPRYFVLAGRSYGKCDLLIDAAQGVADLRDVELVKTICTCVRFDSGTVVCSLDSTSDNLHDVFASAIVRFLACHARVLCI